MQAYSPPWSGIDRAKYLRLDLNENTQPPPSHVVDALKHYIEQNKIQMYPEYEEFLSKLASYAKVDKNCLMITNGSDQAIDIILRAFLTANDTIVICRPEFPIFTQVASSMNVNVRSVSYDLDFKFPYDEFVDATLYKTDFIVMVNPDNPTGASISLEQIKNILKLNYEIPVLVDEAYFEYTQMTARCFLKSHPNLIITRTFSKAFAMAGLRLGYVIAHPNIIAQLYKIRGPFDVNSCALVAAAAQIDFPDEWKKYINETMTISKPYLEQFFDENKIRYYSGAAHFMLVQPANRDGAVEYLKDNGILVRPMTAPLIKNTFRMNVGSLNQTKRFAEVYSKFMESTAK